ncbi:hypothetical protein CA85_44180 [Allorhodopirellula solitaria]|uniref:Uncharacterized protein n=2 Tax=Allorhodopirellula solitaria TaxID=2527987 RepID=A0A5C5WZX9_9BACT|nr:hypothetical protein CA85_44180 [Allorhodopirellula solitaria]
MGELQLVASSTTEKISQNPPLIDHAMLNTPPLRSGRVDGGWVDGGRVGGGTWCIRGTRSDIVAPGVDSSDRPLAAYWR